MGKEQDKLYQYCLRCGRKLKTDETRRMGYGKTCAKKALRYEQLKLFEKISKNT